MTGEQTIIPNEEIENKYINKCQVIVDLITAQRLLIGVSKEFYKWKLMEISAPIFKVARDLYLFTEKIRVENWDNWVLEQMNRGK